MLGEHSHGATDGGVTGFEIEVPLPFAAAKDAAREALKAEGSGILTEIDLQAALVAVASREAFRRAATASATYQSNGGMPG